MRQPPREPPSDARRTDVIDVRLGDLDATFKKRLRADRRRFVTLRAVIARSQTVAQGTIDELQFLAHRMSGAAAIFNYPALTASAQALSDEVKAAPTRNVGGAGQRWLALDALIDMLSRMDDSHRPDRQRLVV
jgi:HPt (histidine-containing phosphotransfer) domain-containing protein